MKTLQEIIQMCKGEEGKIFVMDETGEMQLVIMGAGEYEQLKVRKVYKVESADPEVVNKEIERAQLAEVAGGRGEPSAAEGSPLRMRNPYPAAQPPRVATDVPPKRDMREEVIDPSFNFDEGEDL
jgi:hypothetical protein